MKFNILEFMIDSRHSFASVDCFVYYFWPMSHWIVAMTIISILL